MNSQQDDAKDWNINFILQKLRETNCSQLSEKFFDSNTLLHVAAKLGNDQIVEAILSIQQCQELLKAKNSSGNLPLHVAANAGHLLIVQYLISSSPQRHELLMAQNSNGDLPLHLAAKAGHLSIVQHLVSSSPQHHELLMAQNSNGDLPLHVAVNAGDLSMVQYLVKLSNQCQELLTTNQSSDNIPLPHPPVNANARYQSLVELSHQQLQDPYTSKPLKVKNREGNTPLQLALEKINEVVNNKSSPRMYEEVVMSLIGKDPAEEEEPKEWAAYTIGMDAEMMMERYKRSRTLETKIPPESKHKVTSMDGELYKAVKSQDIDFIKTKGRDLEHSALSDKTPELNTILHLAAASLDDDKFVQEILEIPLCQNFVTEKNSKGDLPLHVAASAGNMQIVTLLVRWSDEHSNCAPLWEKNMEENTPLPTRKIYIHKPKLILKLEKQEH